MSDDSNTDKKSETQSDREDSTEAKSIDQLKNVEDKIEKLEKQAGTSLKRPPEWKNEGTTLVLSIVVGLLGFMGVGHIYLGRVRRGVIILIVGLLSWIAFFIPMVFLGMLGEVEEETFDLTALIGMMGGFVLVGIGVLALFIWQILNSRKLCEEYNDYLEQHGKPPW